MSVKSLLQGFVLKWLKVYDNLSFLKMIILYKNKILVIYSYDFQITRTRCAFFIFWLIEFFVFFGLKVRVFIGLTGRNKQPAHMTCTANLGAEKGFRNKKNQYLEKTGSCYQGNWARHSLESR